MSPDLAREVLSIAEFIDTSRLRYFAGTSTQGSPLPGSLPWVHHLA